MKQRVFQIIVIALFVALAFPSIAFAQGSEGDKFIFGGEYTLKEKQTIQGNLIIFGGKVTLEEESLVKGDIITFGGTLSCNGTIRKNIVAMGGSIDLKEAAVIEGGISLLGTHLDRADTALVEGTIKEGQAGALQWSARDGVQLPEFEVNLSPLTEALQVLLQSFLWAALAILVVLFLPHQTERAAQTAFAQPLIAGGLGLMTALTLPIVLVALMITIILIPASLLGFLALIATWAFGVISLGSEVGRRIGEAFKQNWALPVAGGVGTFVLTLLVNTVASVVPCIGVSIPLLIGSLGIGAILLTRFGTQAYPPADPLAFAAASPPSAYQPASTRDVVIDAPVILPDESVSGEENHADQPRN